MFLLRRATPLLLSSLLCTNVLAQKVPTQTDSAKTTTLVGRVLADVESLGFGAGLGPSYKALIFGVQKGDGPVTPVKIEYAFFKSQGPPPDSFFDHSKLYQLQVTRIPECDETVNSLSYVKNVDQSGKRLQPTYVLRFLEGAPKDVLKSDAVLPCYVLRPGKYKVLSQDKESKM